MKTLWFALFFVFQINALAEESTRLAELDKFWKRISQAVGKGDFEAYRQLHHPDGVWLMHGSPSRMETAHQGFREGFQHTVQGEVQAGIEFRWSQRRGGDGTALERGAYRYWSKSGDVDYVQYTACEAVLVKTSDGWRLLTMNHVQPLTEAQWTALTAVEKQ